MSTLQDDDDDSLPPLPMDEDDQPMTDFDYCPDKGISPSQDYSDHYQLPQPVEHADVSPPNKSVYDDREEDEQTRQHQHQDRKLEGGGGKRGGGYSILPSRDYFDHQQQSPHHQLPLDIDLPNAPPLKSLQRGDQAEDEQTMQQRQRSYQSLKESKLGQGGGGAEGAKGGQHRIQEDGQIKKRPWLQLGSSFSHRQHHQLHLQGRDGGGGCEGGGGLGGSTYSIPPTLHHHDSGTLMTLHFQHGDKTMSVGEFTAGLTAGVLQHFSDFSPSISGVPQPRPSASSALPRSGVHPLVSTHAATGGANPKVMASLLRRGSHLMAALGPHVSQPLSGIFLIPSYHPF